MLHSPLLNGPFCFGPPHHLCWHPHLLRFCEQLNYLLSLYFKQFGSISLHWICASCFLQRFLRWGWGAEPGGLSWTLHRCRWSWDSHVDSWPIVKYSTPVFYLSIAFVFHVDIFHWCMSFRNMFFTCPLCSTLSCCWMLCSFTSLS